jgi:hypothetical protein
MQNESEPTGAYFSNTGSPIYSGAGAYFSNTGSPIYSGAGEGPETVVAVAKYSLIYMGVMTVLAIGGVIWVVKKVRK